MAEPSPLRITDAMADAGELRQPILVASFVRRNGFNSTAVATLSEFARHHEAELVAQMDADQFYDFSVTPPAVRTEGDQRVIEWPKNEVVLVRAPESLRDVLVLTGIEPHLRWPTFSDAIHDFLREYSIEELLVLRTWPGAVPHTRPAMLRLTTTSEKLATELGLPSLENNYRGPVDLAGLVSSLHGNDGGVTGGLTAVVPNYLGVVPNPFAMLALTEVLDRLAGSETPLDDVQVTADELRTRADEEMRNSEEFRDAVEEMERSYENVSSSFTGAGTADEERDELPSSDDILRDVERFLRQED
jgi:proteasome assembly chaperone (PAC2) family protein